MNLGFATNNQAEYGGMIAGQMMARQINIERLEVFGDSKQIICQMKREYKVKAKTQYKVNEQAFMVNKLFSEIQYTHIKRELNQAADKLANKGTFFVNKKRCLYFRS